MTQASVLNGLDVKAIREELDLSQSQLAARVGVSKRAIQSYEQGWRTVSEAVERLLLLLLIAHRNGAVFGKRMCWSVVKCDESIRERCTAYTTRQGHLCWFLTGTLCRGKNTASWAMKKAACAACPFMGVLLHPRKASEVDESRR